MANEKFVKFAKEKNWKKLAKIGTKENLQDVIDVAEACGFGRSEEARNILIDILVRPEREAKIAAIKDQEYTGKAIQPKLKVTCDGWALARNRDYTVAYTNNKTIGQAVVTIIGKGNYYGIKVTSFKINPKKMPSLSLKPGKKSLTVNWKAEKNIDGYEIEYSLKKDFKGSKIQKVKKAKI